MRILSHQCRRFTYSVTSPSLASATAPTNGVEELVFSNCLLLLVGVEAGDAAVTTKAAKAIARITRKTDASLVVINGFSQMADPRSHCDPVQAQQILHTLAELLHQRGLDIHQMPFGWNKRWSADVEGGEWQQRVTHITPPWNTMPAVPALPTVEPHIGGLSPSAAARRPHERTR